jgi:hypothetical protein
VSSVLQSRCLEVNERRVVGIEVRHLEARWNEILSE